MKLCWKIAVLVVLCASCALAQNATDGNGTGGNSTNGTSSTPTAELPLCSEVQAAAAAAAAAAASNGTSTNGTASESSNATTANATSIPCREDPEVTYSAPLMCTKTPIPGEEAEKLTKFEPVPLCIKVDVDAAKGGELESHKWVKAMFFPNLDEFSQLSVPNSQPAGGNELADQLRSDNGAKVYIESMGVSSSGRLWVNSDASVVVNELYVIIEVVDGVVVQILWDPNPCAVSECAATLSLCVDDQCGVRTSELCAEEPANCALRVHVTFVGTDKYTEPLKTANIRKSNWAAYSFAAASEGFLKAAKDFKDSQSGGDGDGGSNGGGGGGDGGSTGGGSPAPSPTTGGNGTAGGNGTDAGNGSAPGNATRRSGGEYGGAGWVSTLLDWISPIPR